MSNSVDGEKETRCYNCGAINYVTDTSKLQAQLEDANKVAEFYGNIDTKGRDMRGKSIGYIAREYIAKYSLDKKGIGSINT